MEKFSSYEARAAAVATGEVSARNSTVQDGNKHYAVMRYYDDGAWEVKTNLTGTDGDNLPYAEHLAQNCDHGPFGEGVAGYGAERIA